MFEFYIILTGAVILIGGLWAWRTTRDPFYPAVVITPLFFYFYCVWPLIIERDGELAFLFGPEQLDYVALLYLFSIVALYVGLLQFPRRVRLLRRQRDNMLHLVLAGIRPADIYALGIFLGLLSVLAYLHLLENAGGFLAAYSRSKGGGYASSGYIGEATLLSFPAIALIAIARRTANRLRIQDVILVLLIAAPHLIQGTIGGRRGPLFLILMTLLVAWYWSRGRRPSLGGLFLGVLAISLAVLAIFSHRSDIRVGADVEFDLSRLIGNVAPESVLIANAWIGNEYAAGIATVLTSDYHHDYYWGYRYFVTFLIRPIPRQIWPSKYEDMGADWLRHEDSYVMERSIAAVGYPLVNGASTGSIADVYMEFAWGVVLVFYLLGRAFGLAWRRHRTRGGIWSVWFIAMLVLSIYLPTQSFSAWLHRLLFMGIVTSLFWRFWIRPRRVVGRMKER